MLIALPAVIANIVLVFGITWDETQFKVCSGVYALCREANTGSPDVLDDAFQHGPHCRDDCGNSWKPTGYLSNTQFSIIVTVVILSAVVPTLSRQTVCAKEGVITSCLPMLSKSWTRDPKLER